MRVSLKKKLAFLKWRFFPVIKGVVFFDSFKGQYNDNPKPVSERLHAVDNNIKIVWAISDSTLEKGIPDYILPVKPYSSEYMKYISRAEVVVDNMDGVRGKVSVNSIPFIDLCLKRKDQLNISTWHGTPLKKIGLDLPNSKYHYMYSSSNYILSGCKHTYDRLSQAFFPNNIILTGTPRNDCLVGYTKDKREEYLSKIGLSAEYRYVLFAPTFRESVFESGVHQIEDIDFKQLLETLEKKFGGQWKFILRLHHEVEKKIDFVELKNKYNTDFINGNVYQDMADYLMATDILITDYSGSLFDFALTKKPCFLYALDRPNYITNERGVYIPIEDLPYSFSDSANDLYSQIDMYQNENMVGKINKFLEKIGNAEDGSATHRVVEMIFDFLSKAR